VEIVEIVETVEIVGVEVEEVAILGGEVVATEMSIVVTGEASTEEVQDILDHHVDAIHETEARLEGLQGSQILTYPVVEGDRDETTVSELLPPHLDHHLLPDQTLVLHLAAVSVLPRDHARPRLAGDPELQTGEEVPTEAVEVGEEEEVQSVPLVEDLPPLREAHARALQGHLKEEQRQTLLAHLLHPELGESVVTLVQCLGHLLDHLFGHLVGEFLAAEKGSAPRQRQTSRRMPWTNVLEVVNAG
jgi:hypothetical protein